MFFIRAISGFAVAAAALLVRTNKPAVGVSRWVNLELALGFCLHSGVQPRVGGFVSH